MTPLTGPCEALLVMPAPNGAPRVKVCGAPGTERLDLPHRGVVGEIICDEHYADALAGQAARILEA